MSEVTVRAIQPVLGLTEGSVVTIEETPRVAAAIKSGALFVEGRTADVRPDDDVEQEAAADEKAVTYAVDSPPDEDPVPVTVEDLDVVDEPPAKKPRGKRS